MNKKHFAFILFASLMLLLAACGGSEETTDTDTASEGGDDGEVYTLQAGHSLPDSHPYHISFLEMAENVAERTDGRVNIEVFPNSEIGAEYELTEGMTLGTVDLVVSSTAPVTNFVPELAVLDLPFLFNDRDTAVDILNSEIGDEMLDKMEEKGIVGLSWAENGFRHITNSKHPIEKPEDLKGLKIRTQENDIHLAAFEELGALATPMAWTEALTALQQGTLDAQENPLIVADQFSLYESKQKYMTLTGHVYSVAIFMMSKETYDKLPEDLRDIVVEEGQRIGEVQRDLLIQMDEEALQVLKDNDVEVIEDVDIQPFQDIVKGVYDEFEAEYGYGDVLEQILEAQE